MQTTQRNAPLDNLNSFYLPYHLSPKSRSLSTITPTHSLSTEDLESLAQILERLRTRLPSLSTKHQLRVQLPAGRNIPRSLHLLVNNWVVVLQVGTESLGLERSPDGELAHAVGLRRPDGELVGVDAVGFLHAADDGAVFEEEDLVGRVSECLLSF